MIPSGFPWKVVIFFGKEHVIWSNISGVVIGLSWQIKFGKFHYLFCSCFSNFDFSTSSYRNTTISGPIDMFFTKKSNYFSRETRWNFLFLAQTPLKRCFLSWPAGWSDTNCKFWVNIWWILGKFLESHLPKMMLFWVNSWVNPW